MEMNKTEKRISFYQQGNLVGTRELPAWTKYFPTFCFFNAGEVTIVEV